MSEPAIDGGTYLRLVGLGAVIGIPAAFLAALFLAVVHDLERWLWESLPSALGHSAPPWYLVILLPAAGACVVLLARTLLPGDGGHSPLEGIGGGGPTPVSHAPGIALAALGTLSFGAVLGPEAPLIALGSVVGMIVALSGAFGQREQSVLATAGSFAAISALFGGPIVGGMMMVEGGLALGTAL
ncbi:MAG TPA: chloride channel protein, partial [Gaiellaceae bacterium]|nr:chloride channel protein [Gaiellaceae bacterium]